MLELLLIKIFLSCTACSSDGQVFAFGNNKFYQLGLGDSIPRCEPTLLHFENTEEDHITQVSCGEYHSAALSGNTYYHTLHIQSDCLCCWYQLIDRYQVVLSNAAMKPAMLMLRFRSNFEEITTINQFLLKQLVYSLQGWHQILQRQNGRNMQLTSHNIYLKVSVGGKIC